MQPPITRVDIPISGPTTDPCTYCNGTGYVEESGEETDCPVCETKGYIEEPR